MRLAGLGGTLWGYVLHNSSIRLMRLVSRKNDAPLFPPSLDPGINTKRSILETAASSSVRRATGLPVNE